MANRKFRIIHCLNNHFGGFGGEEATDMAPKVINGPVGTGRKLLEPALADQAEIIASVVTGDNRWTSDKMEETLAMIVQAIKDFKPDLIIAGPALNAGRYGTGCGAIGKAVKEELGIPVVSGMYEENPGVDVYRQYLYIVKTAAHGLFTKDAIKDMAALAIKILKGQEVLPESDNYFPRFRQNFFDSQSGAVRAVEMLQAKMAKREFITEYPIPQFDRVVPGQAIDELSNITVGLVTSGGIVEAGNPDGIEASSARKFGEYSLKGIEYLTPETHQSVHGGYDATYANIDPNRVLPLDALRDMEKKGIIGKIHDLYYATVGNGTSVAKAKQFGAEIAKRLKAAEVQLVILTST